MGEEAQLTLHEARFQVIIYQLALQREMEHLPPFRRYGVETAFNEGWGLYAESRGGRARLGLRVL